MGGSPGIGVAKGGGMGPLIEMLLIIKTSQKRLLFLQFQFLLASLHTTVINNNIDPGGPGPLNLILANQLKWAPTIIFKWPPTIILIQWARAPSI